MRTNLRIEEIRAEIRALQAELDSLLGNDEDVLNTVASSSSIKAAAEKLGISEKELTQQLESSGIPHFYGEQWRFAVNRYKKSEIPKDGYTYPAILLEKKEAIVKALRDGRKFKDVADRAMRYAIDAKQIPDTTKNFTNILGRFLQVNGYNKDGVNVGVPEWMK